jgi:hypothetical protein
LSNRPDYSNNPYSHHRQQVGQQGHSSQSGRTPGKDLLIVPAIVLLVMCGIWLIFNGLSIIGAVMGQEQQALPGVTDAQLAGREAGKWSAIVIMPLLNILALGGAIAMLTRKAYGFALTGAFVSLIPLCGPCLGLTLPMGIWALILLFQPHVKKTFS